MSKNKKKQTLSVIGALLFAFFIYLLGRATGGKDITSWQYYNLEQHTDLQQSLDDVDEVLSSMGYEHIYRNDSSTTYQWSNLAIKKEGDFRSQVITVHAFTEEGRFKLEIEHRGNFNFFKEERIDSTFSEIERRYNTIYNTD